MGLMQISAELDAAVYFIGGEKKFWFLRAL